MQQMRRNRKIIIYSTRMKSFNWRWNWLTLTSNDDDENVAIGVSCVRTLSSVDLTESWDCQQVSERRRTHRCCCHNRRGFLMFWLMHGGRWKNTHSHILGFFVCKAQSFATPLYTYFYRNFLHVWSKLQF